MPKSKSSKRWIQEHTSDHYVKTAKKEGRRSRSFYKIKEMQEQCKFMKPGITMIDLGASPGGWSQYAAQIIGPKGQIFALDILPMQPITNVKFVLGDFRDTNIKAELTKLLENHICVDLIISDMAPNLSGVEIADQANALELIEAALAFAEQTLKDNGTLLVKIFQGVIFNAFSKKLRTNFQNVKTIKPKSSRSQSKEVYLLATGFLRRTTEQC